MKNITVIDWNSPRQYGHFEDFNGLFEDLKGCREVNLRFIKFGINQSNIVKLIFLEKLMQKEKVSHIFLTWLHDIVEIQEEFEYLLRKYRVTCSGLAAISHKLRKAKGVAARTSRKNADSVLRMIEKSKQITGLVSWDPGAIKLNQPTLHVSILPDYQDLSVDISEIPKQHIDLIQQSKLRVGFIGQLYPYRGLSRLFWIALANPSIDFYLIGKRSNFYGGYRRIYEIYLWKRVAQLRNCLIIEGYVESSKSLNWYISQMHCIFLDTRSYPNPSGIVSRALSLGRRVLITSKNSALLDIYKECPQIRTLTHPLERIDKKIANSAICKHLISRESAVNVLKEHFLSVY